MQTLWLPQIAQWTSLSVDSMSVLQHLNVKHAHTGSERLGHHVSREAVVQFAHADPCVVFAFVGEKDECINPFLPVPLKKK